MPKAPKQPYDRKGRFLRGVWHSSHRAVRVCVEVGCPKCHAAKTWPCFSLTAGIETSTPHAARWEAWYDQKAED